MQNRWRELLASGCTFLGCELCIQHCLCTDCPLWAVTNGVGCGKGSFFEEWAEHILDCEKYLLKEPTGVVGALVLPDDCPECRRLARRLAALVDVVRRYKGGVS